MIGCLLLAIALVIIGTAVYKLHPVPILILSAFIFGLSIGIPIPEILNALTNGFGNTQKSIGLVIVAGTIIGMFMEKRGAFLLLATKVTQVTGTKRLPLAMTIIGFVVSIAIFCDSAFVILIGLWKKMSLLYKIPMAIGATALSMGLFASHCFIPPTPGPLAAVSLLSADIGLVIVFGAVCALTASLSGYFYACKFGAREVIETTSETSPETEQEIVMPKSWFVALLPLLLPLLFIAMGSVGKFFLQGRTLMVIQILGNPLIALMLGTFLAIFAIGKCHKKELMVDGIIGGAIMQAANILVITGAGGAFGEVLRLADIAKYLPEGAIAIGSFAIFIPIIISAMLKTAHGSSTIAIITAAGIMAPLLSGFHWETPILRALVCCAVCCGAMIVSHTNDSYFWVVTKFSGMSIRQGLKLQTGGSFVSGVAAAIIIWLMTLCFL